MKTDLSALLLVTFIVSACSTEGPRQPEPVAHERPAWINDPGEGVSAAAGFHVRGTQAQEELAITRARDEFAKRYGVNISSEQATSQIVVGDRMSSVSARDIREEVQQKEVKATVRAKWNDPNTGMLWVWLVPAN